MNNVSIIGRGKINGQGEKWWKAHEINKKLRREKYGKEREPENPEGSPLRVPRPRLVNLYNCINVLISELTFVDSPAWTIHPVYCENVSIEKISIIQPYDSPNTDGINPESCRNVRITGCFVDVGDDCITIKSGYNEDGRRVGIPCENIVISDCTFANGRSAIGIGSEMSGGIKNVTISNCVFNGTLRGLRIKSNRDRGGTVENYNASNVVMSNVETAISIDTTLGDFGPFEGQMFVGDQGHSKIMRVAMEKVNGVYQGASFPFIEGFSSGILRMIWGSDSSMFVGMTSRGWSSTGKGEYGLQRLVWTGKTPFEIKTIKAENNGFTVEFTKPVSEELASKTSSYKMTTFNYDYHNTYGSDIVGQEKVMVHEATVAADGLSVKLLIHGMKLGFIHQLKVMDITTTAGESLLHNTGYYTLNEVPGGVLKSPQMHKMSKTGNIIDQPKRTNEMPLNWSNGPKLKFDIGTVPGLKFDFKEIKVKRRQRIQFTLNNNDDMLHNLVIIKPGAENADKVGQMALELGLDGPDMNFVPASDLVLFHTGIVQPETSETIYFSAPKEPGEYWVLCTFPGHSYTMRAKLIVE